MGKLPRSLTRNAADIIALEVQGPQDSSARRQQLLMPLIAYIVREAEKYKLTLDGVLDNGIRYLNARPLADGTFVFQGRSGRWWKLTTREMLVVGWNESVAVFDGVLPQRMPADYQPPKLEMSA